MRDAILVLGMHRSGTSAITGAMTHLGAAAPNHLMNATVGNERGYFESVPFMHFHDALLTSAGSCWHDWRQLEEIARDALVLEQDQALLGRIGETAKRRFDRALKAANALRGRYLNIPPAMGA